MFMKTCKTAVCASALMAVAAWSGGAFAGVAQDFEANSDGITGTGGSLGAGGLTTAPACGFPSNFVAHTRVLAITGTVTYTEGTAASSNASQVDFMFKAEPTDELEDIDDAAVKVALAVVTNGTSDSSVSLKLWCKAKDAANASWVPLCDVPSASWARATLVLDYETERCRVSINGDPQVTANAAEDAWYRFANGKETNYLKSVTMVGSTEIDDFVVSHTALANYEEPFEGTAVTAGGVDITYDDLNKYGVTVAEATANDDLSPNQVAGMTVSQKIAAGLNPKSATKFEMQTMTAVSATAATITFPGNKGTSSYTVTATADKAGTGDPLETATITSGAANEFGETINSAAFSNLPDNTLIYFHLKSN